MAYRVDTICPPGYNVFVGARTDGSLHGLYWWGTALPNGPGRTTIVVSDRKWKNPRDAEDDARRHHNARVAADREQSRAAKASAKESE